MVQENAVSRPFTRAFASSLRASTTHNQQRANRKRPASEEDKKNITAPTPNKKKKRVVLGDISNVGFNAAKLEEAKNIIKQVKKESVDTSEVTDLQSKTHAKAEGVSNDTADNCKSDVIGTSTSLGIPKVINIDSDDKDPLLCCLYAPEIYHNLRVSEVSEEYTLVPDTLYLTVYLIDWFLHGNHIERQNLQLLGITCMLIASKYEEICAPRVEEFCLMTDNTYTREQVLEMENQVLAHFSFQIYTPTPKTFLRRFLRAAAQASSYLSQRRRELEFLASYLTELTLLDYRFLKFLPSVIAASAVFLAKWTLDQSNHPWNLTLEHYTTYKASDLKASVHALQDLQLNTRGCPLSAIRMKYRQEKFKSVAVLISPKLLDTLF
ncbi:cyclin-A2-3 isoform X3 [Brassica rapa]|uniref:cyclin-A2-3 isoform X3 n=1 Tax=Brassica campestris TaxID=3711 RepID=UPI00142E7319|nr:cyclin-A2-3 isoform X3 [Brassica rapa]